MFTKEGLLSMKYKELVLIAKQCGVYKSRCKKIYLLDRLLTLPLDKELDNEQHCPNGGIEESIVGPSQKADSIYEDPGTKTEDFEVAENVCIDMKENDLDLIIPLNRRETFSICKDSRKPELQTEIQGICDKGNLSPVEKGRISVLRQNTFSIDKPSINQKFKEMPGIICQEVNTTPKIKPYIVNETSASLIGPKTPMRTRNSIHPSSVKSFRSIGQRIESQRSTKSEVRLSNRGPKQQKNYSINTESITPIRVHKTSMKGGRIEKKITPSKLPNFKAIHMHEFSKMESIVEHTLRKAERTKTLMTPIKFNHILANKLKQTPSVMSPIPMKLDLKTKKVEAKNNSILHNKSETSSRKNISNIPVKQKFNFSTNRSRVSNVKEKLMYIDSPMTKVRRKSGNTVDITNKIVSNPKKRVENVKEIVTTKMHPFSVERNRVKGRDFLQSVRTNRRFQLQMEVMRRAKI